MYFSDNSKNKIICYYFKVVRKVYKLVFIIGCMENKWKNKEFIKKYQKEYRQRPEVKEKRGKNYLKNKEKIKEYNQRPEVKVRRNEYEKEIREIREEKGLCTSCGKERENLKFKKCYKCREYFRIYAHKISKKKKELKNNERV